MEKRRVETDKLLDWAFRTYTTVSPDWHKAAPSHLRVYKGNVDEVPIAPASGRPYFTVGHGDETKMTLTAALPSRPLVAPIAKGTEVGALSIMIAGKPISSTPLVPGREASPNSRDSIYLSSPCDACSSRPSRFRRFRNMVRWWSICPLDSISVLKD